MGKRLAQRAQNFIGNTGVTASEGVKKRLAFDGIRVQGNVGFSKEDQYGHSDGIEVEIDRPD